MTYRCSPSLPMAGPLREARFLERPNRFVVQARLGNGHRVIAHLADPGRLRELLLPGRRLWLRHAREPHRKTRWSAALVESPDSSSCVSLDTGLPNRLVGRALEEGALEELEGWRLERREYTIGTSRFDFLLQRRRGGHGPRRMALEVKSVTLVEGRVGLFPDAVTARGTRHVRELTALRRSGDWAAAVLFVLQRPDADRIMPDARIDPDFARALAEAHRAGVRLLGRRCTVGLEAITLGQSVPVVLPRGGATRVSDGDGPPEDRDHRRRDTIGRR
jgi:sugar fermentation stimulation protein A